MLEAGNIWLEAVITKRGSDFPISHSKQIKEAGLPYLIEQMTSSTGVPPALTAAIGRITAQQMEAAVPLIKAINWKPSPTGPT